MTQNSDSVTPPAHSPATRRRRANGRSDSLQIIMIVGVSVTVAVTSQRGPSPP